MIGFRRFVALLLLVLWGPVTVHCGLELDGLIAAGDHAQKASPGATDTDPDGCESIEGGQFEFSLPAWLAGPPVWIVEDVLDVFEFHLHSVEPGNVRPDLRLVFERTSPWPFAQRAALPARAPTQLT